MQLLLRFRCPVGRPRCSRPRGRDVGRRQGADVRFAACELLLVALAQPLATAEAQSKFTPICAYMVEYPT